MLKRNNYNQEFKNKLDADDSLRFCNIGFKK